MSYNNSEPEEPDHDLMTPSTAVNEPEVEAAALAWLESGSWQRAYGPTSPPTRLLPNGRTTANAFFAIGFRAASDG